MPEDMPDHMPEDMPDRMPNRMSEDMSDRMPEDLPVRKCINVMVGITRSKVIVFLTSLAQLNKVPNAHFTLLIHVCSEVRHIVRFLSPKKMFSQTATFFGPTCFCFPLRSQAVSKGRRHGPQSLARSME